MPTRNLDPIVNSVPSNIRSRARTVVPALMQEILKQNITDKAQIAYILATAEHESQMGKYMSEIWDPNSVPAQQDYDAPGDPKQLGNRPNYSPNQNYTNGDGYRYRGRGYVQLTGRANYQDWSKKLGVDLVSNPDLASDPAFAAQVMVRGMKDGSFTGYRLGEFIHDGSQVDFYNARKIVNGLDRAGDISAIANSYYEVLKQIDLQQLKEEIIPPRQAEAAASKQTNPATFAVSAATGEPKQNQAFSGGGVIGNQAKSANLTAQAVVGGQVVSQALLQYGDRGEAVKQVQTALNKTGAKLDVDGVFGSRTQQAVMSFQRRKGLQVDGVVGSKTFNALDKMLQQKTANSMQNSAANVSASQPAKQPAIKLELLSMPSGATYHGASRNGGSRFHAGTDTYNPNKTAATEAPQATLGGVILKVGTETDANGKPVGYGHYIDIYNPQLKVVERIAEFDHPKFTQADVGKNIPAGTIVGTGATQTTIIHREARPYEIYRQGPEFQYGYAGTVDWVKYMEQLNLYRQQGQDLVPTGRTIPAQQMEQIQSSLTPDVQASIAGVMAQGTPAELPTPDNSLASLTATLQENLSLEIQSAETQSAKIQSALTTTIPSPQPQAPSTITIPSSQTDGMEMG